MTDTHFDKITSFALENSDVRGRIVRLGASLDEILTRHNYPEPVSEQVARTVLINAAMGSMLKLRWKLSLQIRGEAGIRLVATDYFAPSQEGMAANIRGYCRFEADELETAKASGSLFGKAVMGVVIDQGAGTEPYQGITLLSGDLAESAAAYFEQSEQLPTFFKIDVARDMNSEGNPWRGGVIMVQRLPGATSSEGTATGREDFDRVKMLTNTTDITELLDPTLAAERLIYRLYHEETPVKLDEQDIAFGCTCSEEKLRESLKMYGPKDIEKMTDDEGFVTGDCQFCGAHYQLDPSSLELDGK